ncbi:hypothetical protein PybrP1_007858 [[Pythium] brassicae (nom. inval.)]|nr:hypothetical protein PybrP1_007858 [[Pythium] brassicae (nom. inval.)]
MRTKPSSDAVAYTREPTSQSAKHSSQDTRQHHDPQYTRQCTMPHAVGHPPTHHRKRRSHQAQPQVPRAELDVVDGLARIDELRLVAPALLHAGDARAAAARVEEHALVLPDRHGAVERAGREDLAELGVGPRELPDARLVRVPLVLEAPLLSVLLPNLDLAVGRARGEPLAVEVEAHVVDEVPVLRREAPEHLLWREKERDRAKANALHKRAHYTILWELARRNCGLNCAAQDARKDGRDAPP